MKNGNADTNQQAKIRRRKKNKWKKNRETKQNKQKF